MSLLPLIAFDATLHDILRLAFVPGEFDTVDATVAHVDEVHVVDEATEEAGAAGGIGADAVALQWEILFRLGRLSRDDRCGSRPGRPRLPGPLNAAVRSASWKYA